jgi:DNA-binding transcriptional MerR regulator
MSDLDRILKLSGLVQGNGFEAPVEESRMSDLDIDAQENSREAFIEMHSSTLGGAEEAGKFWDDSKESRDSNEGIETEAVGTAADPIMDLCDEVGCDPDHPIFQEIVRFLDADQIKEFVDDYRRHHEMNASFESDEVEVDEASCGSKKKHKHESTEEVAEVEEPVQEAEGTRTIEVNKDIELAMDSIWDRRSEQMTEMVFVKEITINEDEDGYLSVEVEHDGPWEIYTDTAFPEAISEICGCEVDWSEQGMQDEGMAHLEGELMEAYESISETFHTELMRELKD